MLVVFHQRAVYPHLLIMENFLYFHLTSSTSQSTYERESYSLLLLHFIRIPSQSAIIIAVM